MSQSEHRERRLVAELAPETVPATVMEGEDRKLGNSWTKTKWGELRAPKSRVYYLGVYAVYGRFIVIYCIYGVYDGFKTYGFKTYD